MCGECGERFRFNEVFAGLVSFINKDTGRNCKRSRLQVGVDLLDHPLTAPEVVSVQMRSRGSFHSHIWSPRCLFAAQSTILHFLCCGLAPIAALIGCLSHILVKPGNKAELPLVTELVQSPFILPCPGSTSPADESSCSRCFPTFLA